jgi:hypothetical protein
VPGPLVIVAAGRSELNTATGLDGALKTLGAQPGGAAILIGAGVGIITYARTASPSLDTPKCKCICRIRLLAVLALSPGGSGWQLSGPTPDR